MRRDGEWGDPNRYVYRRNVIRDVDFVCLVYEWARRLRPLWSEVVLVADVRFGYRHVILHALPAADIAALVQFNGRAVLVGAYCFVWRFMCGGKR